MRVLVKKGIAVTIGRGSALKYYYDRGDLDLANSAYSADDRFAAGQWLAEKYYAGHFETVRAKRLDIEPVDGDAGTNAAFVIRALDAQAEYLHAFAAIPAEYWSTVREVVVNNNLFVRSANRSKNSNNCEIFYRKRQLAHGLDYLCRYLQSGRKKKRPTVNLKSKLEQLYQLYMKNDKR